MKEALAQLTMALSQFQSSGIDLFFRDDDVDVDERSLRALLELFIQHSIPINLEIIPGRLAREAIDLLRRYKDKHPDLFEFNQHGWLHLNHEREGRKCEFGPSRSFDDQLSDISIGKKVLEDAFGKEFSPVFTPPWNRCTSDTFRALDQLGFQGISKIRSDSPVTGYSFREVSVTLDLYRWSGGAAMRSPEEIVEELISQMSGPGTVGIMLHHKVMNEDAFKFLKLLLDEVSRYQFIDFHTFQSLLRMI
jgi:peptidoglycan/xylan/chitin deacetylase (PgdA/CDA1 family)